jgi:RNA polymerase sigma-70 factor (family 1)
MQDKAVIGFQHGNKGSYQAIFIQLYPVMCLFARKFINDYDDAEDIVQEIFIELWHQRAKFESTNQIKAFLYLSIKNKCINYNNHLRVKEKHAQTEQPDNDVSFEEYVIEAEVVHSLYVEINKLPEQRKRVILLSMEGLKNNEIADSMQISINTVKQQKKLAYQQLREKLKPSHHILFLLF